MIKNMLEKVLFVYIGVFELERKIPFKVQIKVKSSVEDIISQEQAEFTPDRIKLKCKM